MISSGGEEKTPLEEGDQALAVPGAWWAGTGRDRDRPAGGDENGPAGEPVADEMRSPADDDAVAVHGAEGSHSTAEEDAATTHRSAEAPDQPQQLPEALQEEEALESLDALRRLVSEWSSPDERSVPSPPSEPKAETDAQIGREHQVEDWREADAPEADPERQPEFAVEPELQLAAEPEVAVEPELQLAAEPEVAVEPELQLAAEPEVAVEPEPGLERQPGPAAEVANEVIEEGGRDDAPQPAAAGEDAPAFPALDAPVPWLAAPASDLTSEAWPVDAPLPVQSDIKEKADSDVEEADTEPAMTAGAEHTVTRWGDEGFDRPMSFDDRYFDEKSFDHGDSLSDPPTAAPAAAPVTEPARVTEPLTEPVTEPAPAAAPVTEPIILGTVADAAHPVDGTDEEALERVPRVDPGEVDSRPGPARGVLRAVPPPPEEIDVGRSDTFESVTPARRVRAAVTLVVVIVFAGVTIATAIAVALGVVSLALREAVGA